ncbi:MAG: glycosyltransferase family 39 protein [Candidatus Altiarchaeota archaeon]
MMQSTSNPKPGRGQFHAKVLDYYGRLSGRFNRLPAFKKIAAITSVMFLAFSIHPSILSSGYPVVDGVWDYSYSNDFAGWYWGNASLDGWWTGPLPIQVGGLRQVLFRGVVNLSRADSLSMDVLADDCVSEFYVNDRLVFEEKNCGKCTHCFGLALNVSEGLKAGSNTLAFKLLNGGGDPVGLKIGYVKEEGVGSPPVVGGVWNYSYSNDSAGWYGSNSSLDGWWNGSLPLRVGGLRQVLVRGIVNLSRVEPLSIGVSADDCVSEFYVNDRLVFEEKNCGKCTHCFGLALNVSEGLKAGSNTLAFKLLNGGGGPVKLEMSTPKNTDTRAIRLRLILVAVCALLVLIMPGRKASTLIVLLLLSSYLMYYGSMDWRSKRLYDFNFRLFTGIADKIISHGFFKARFGQPVYTDGNGTVNYYVHHPPLLSIFTALSFKALTPIGTSRSTAALIVPTIFSFGALALLYLIADRLWGRVIASVSVLVMALTPMFRSFSRMLCHEPVVTFFLLAVLYYYILWMDTRKKRYFTLVCLILAVGCFTGWPAYYIMPLLAGHHLLFSPKKDARILALPILGIVFFSVFIAHIYVLGGMAAIEDLKGSVKFRVDYNRQIDALGYPNYMSLVNSVDVLKSFFTPTLFYASILFMVSVIHDIIKKRSILPDSYIIILLLVAVTHNFLWPFGRQVHGYWSYYFTPAIALASVVGLNKIIKSSREDSKTMVWIILLAAWISTLSIELVNPLIVYLD